MVSQMAALGMIETRGVAALIAAADAAAKTADVRVARYEMADAGIVTVYILGDVSAVQAAVQSASAAARQVGELLSSHVIPRPDESVPHMIKVQRPEQMEQEDAKTPPRGAARTSRKLTEAENQDKGSDPMQ